MGRAFPQSQPYDYGPDPQQGEWQALRGELVALLDQVETQVARSGRHERGYPGLAERMRELRDQVGDIDPDDRHREALRSVKRAVDRFSERDEAAYAPSPPGYPPNPRDSLQTAIQQIRARQLGATPPPPEPPQRPREASGFEELARAFDGVASRIERLETELGAQARGQSSNVKEIADQVAQLSHVVELLAGAVGETGQVKRLEAQIAGLARLVADGPQLDLSALNSRIDDVSATLGRLADLQVQYAGKIEAPTALHDAMTAVEAGVRNIYDRIDAIEAHHALAPEAVDALAAEMARFTQALAEARPEGPVALVDGLAARIGQIEGRHGDVAGLKADLHDLRGAIGEAMEPRFAAIETQIEALSGRLGRHGDDLTLAQIEAQVRQLVARMDQTGEQLSGIARLQDRREDPDFEALADLVATRTSQAVARVGATDDDAGVRKSIDEVNTRLARLEASLAAGLGEAPAGDPVFPAAAPNATLPRTGSDAMPANPAADAPLIDRPPTAPGVVQAALAARHDARPPVPGSAAAEPAPRAPAPRPPFDPALVARPPRPQSSLEAEPAASFAATPASAPETPAEAVAETAPPATAPATTSTFIAAARRAAQRQQPAAAPRPAAPGKAEPVSRSLIARALQGGHPVRAEGLGSAASDKPAAAATEMGPKGFLRRHGRLILLGVSVVVLSLLTLNLVNQRLADEARSRAAATPGDSGALVAPLPSQPARAAGAPAPLARVIPIADSIAVASIDPAAARGFAPSAAIPQMPRTFTAVDRTAPPAAAPPPAAGAVRMELPPAAVGPEAMRQAAADGDARAQFEVAAVYTEGRAVPEDLEVAAVWYERAAAQGFAPAQSRLGNLYEHGQGVTRDLEQARLWYQRAAEAGNRMSMHNLAALHAGGALGRQQFDTAARWFEQAAERGLKDSQFNLGMLHARGLGVPQDLELSYKWFSIAAMNGDADAAKARDDVAASLAADVVGRLNAEVAAWTPAAIDLAANFAPIGTWNGSFDPGRTIASQDVVESVQLALRHLGYDVGTPDGLAGPKTAEAIRAFERATGMSESGAVNPRLLAVLGSQPG